MVMKEGKAWGVNYSDGQCTSYGWISPVNAPIHNPRYCKRTTDVTHRRSGYTRELETAKLVKVKRTTIVEII